MSTQEALSKFESVYDETYDDVLKYLVCNVARISDVADIIQDVYLAVYKKIKKNISREYVLGIARHKLKDYYRLRYRHKDNKLDYEIDMVADSIDLLEDVILEEQISLVWDYLSKKKSIISKIFFLYYYENNSLKDIASILKISESNVKHYLYRTLKEINKILKEGDEK